MTGSAQEVGTALAVAGKPARWLTKEEADEAVARGELVNPHVHGMWDEQLQRFVPFGEKVALDVQRRESDPDWQLAQFERQRQALMRFVQTKLQEAEYDERGYPLKGKLHDSYKLPGFDKAALTKAGAEKVGNLLRFRVLSAKITHSIETREYVSARVNVELVDTFGRPVGAFEAACSSAEAGFQAMGVQKKYGARFKKTRDGWDCVVAPDYRAGLHDIASRAKKRGYVGAVITAANLMEIFDLAASTGAASDEAGDGATMEPPVQPTAGPSARTTQAPAPETVKKPLTIGGLPLSTLTTAQLEKAYAGLMAMAPEEQAKRQRHLDAIVLEIEDRRSFAVPPKAVREADEDLLDLPLGDGPVK